MGRSQATGATPSQAESMAAEANQHTEEQLPNRPLTWWKSPTALSSQLAGLLLFASLWLPIAEGCKGNVIQPVNGIHISSSLSLSESIFSLLLAIAFTNGLFIAASLAISGLLNSSRLWRVLFAIQTAFSLLLLALFFVFTISEIHDVRSAAESVLGVLPLAIIPTAWVAWAFWQRRWTDAWARLQHVWTMLAFIYVQLGTLFARRLFFGYFVFVLALLAMVLSVELARNRMAHDLWDHTQAVGRFNFSIRGILIWTSILALILGYYQSLTPWIDWIDGCFQE